MWADDTRLPRVGVIVSTYERPAALAAVLAGLSEQTYRRFEVVVADDGSGPSTRQLVERFADAGRLCLRHIWQEDRGWRLSAVRNRAIAALETEYLVFIDGDCVVRSNFVARHARLAERGWFVRGNRVLLGPELTEKALIADPGIHRWNRIRWLGQRLRGRMDRFTPLLSLPLGGLRKLSPDTLTGVAGYNLAAWRDDVVAINGFDESYEGWGSEDVDFAMRLSRHGVRRKDGRLAVPVLHLWHPSSSRGFEAENAARLLRRRQSGKAWIEKGVVQT